MDEEESEPRCAYVESVFQTLSGNCVHIHTNDPFFILIKYLPSVNDFTHFLYLSCCRSPSLSIVRFLPLVAMCVSVCGGAQ